MMRPLKNGMNGNRKRLNLSCRQITIWPSSCDGWGTGTHPLAVRLNLVYITFVHLKHTMKTNTQYTIKLDSDEMTILRDLVRIGMKSKYYKNFSTEEIDDYECEDIRDKSVLAVQQFVNLNPVGQIEAMFDTTLFEGVAVH